MINMECLRNTYFTFCMLLIFFEYEINISFHFHKLFFVLVLSLPPHPKFECCLHPNKGPKQILTTRAFLHLGMS